MTEEIPVNTHLECRLHALLCGSLEGEDLNELLSEIAADEQARTLLAEMLEIQKTSRAAFGYDRAHAAIGESLCRLRASMANAASEPSLIPSPRRRSTIRRFRRLTYVWRVAAAIAIMVSSYFGVAAYRSNRITQNQLAEMRLTQLDLAKYKVAWDQMGDDSNTVVLLTGNDGEAGKIPLQAQPEENSTRAVLMQVRVLDRSGRCVCKADLLMPDKRLYFKLPNIGDVAGQPASLAVAKSTNRAIIGFSVGSEENKPAGVLGETVIGSTGTEIGSFDLQDQQLKLFVTTERLDGRWG